MFEKGKGPWDKKYPQDNGQDNENKTINLQEKIKKEQKSPTDQDPIIEFFKKIFEFFKQQKNQKRNNPDSTVIKSKIITILLFIMVIWLATGLYKVNSDENGVVFYFGKFHSISEPGLNYFLPQPFGRVEKVSVTKINKEEFGFNSTSDKNSYNFESESLMLTGDENIADIDFEVQWKVGNVKDFLFNISNPRLTIRKTTESAMREIIAKRPIDDALANKKSDIEREVKDLLQKILDSYGSGIEIVLVQMLRVDPPQQVINAFRDVQTARADKERKINEAEAYKNDIMPKARGEAVQITQEADAYKQSKIAEAIGQAERFNKVYREYSKTKNITRRRMYLETMEEVYKNVDKIIIDDQLSKSVLPYLPLNKANNK